MAVQPSVVTLSFFDSESKGILNKIHQKLEDLDQKLGFVTQFLLQKVLSSSFEDQRSSQNCQPNLGSKRPRSNGASSPGRGQMVEDALYRSLNRGRGRKSTVTPAQNSPPSMPNLHQRPSVFSLIAAAEVNQRKNSMDGATSESPASVKHEIFEEEETINDDDEESRQESVSTSALEVQSAIASTSGTNNEYNSPVEIFPTGALRRAADKASRSFETTKPKVFAWQMFRESHSDHELGALHISLRTFHGESADTLLARQLPKVRKIVEMTLAYFNMENLDPQTKLQKAKLILSHLKNNAKVRNWTLKEGKGAGNSRQIYNTGNSPLSMVIPTSSTRSFDPETLESPFSPDAFPESTEK